MKFMFDVVGIDYPCVDLNVNVDALPESNGGTRINNLSWQGGGKVSSGLVTAARLGARCAIAGIVGDDKYGAFCRKDFIDHGIDVKYLKVEKAARTSLDIVISDKKTMGRSMVFYPGNISLLSEDALPLDYLRNTKYFYISGVDQTSKKAAQIAREHGAKIFIDADSYSEALGEYIPDVDIFVASEFVYKKMFSDSDFEKNCRAVMEMGPGIVVFTLGEKGAVGVSDEGYFKIPAYSVDVVDTVGAGDDFHGAFLAGLLQEQWDIEYTAKFASAVSAIKCTRIGGRAGIPDMRTALCFMETGKIDYSEIDERVAYYQRGIEYV